MTFEERFFGPGNSLRWDAIESGSLRPEQRERLDPFLDELRRPSEALVLPRVRDDGTVHWYVLCASPRVARMVRDELHAFVGPTYSDFEGQPAQLDPNDAVDAAVIERCGGNAFRLDVPDRSLRAAARERLGLFVRIRHERPVRHGRRIRATGRILRDLEYALLASDGQTASDCIAELRSTGRLSATNLLFLEVRRLAALGRWSEIVALPEVESLVAIPRPRRVTEALVRAIYAVELRRFEEGEHAAEAVRHFSASILPRYRDLYRSRAGLSGYEVDASFLMVAVASDPPRVEAVEAVLEAYGEGTPGRSYLHAIAALRLLRAYPAPADPLAEARAAFAAADVDRAWKLAVAAPPSFDRCALLLRCARDMGTLEAARTALASIDNLSDAERGRLKQQAVLARIHVELTALTTHVARPAVVREVPSSWPAWLRRLTVSDPSQHAAQVAERGAREWRLEAYLGSPELVAETANLLLSDRPQWGQAALRDALPHLLEFFLAGGTDARLRQIYESLFLVVATDDEVSVPQFAALVRVAEARIQLGVNAGEYREIVGQLASAIESIGSPSVADLALEALDMLVTVPCRDHVERQNALVRVASFFERWYRRIDAAQWALLGRLADELEAPDAVKGPPPEREPAAGSEWSELDGKKIALYSLRESALRRAEAVLRDVCPGVGVQTFHDVVGGSGALRTAAAAADIFVIAVAAAKHAATKFIEAHRPDARPTVYARGQGSASLLGAIRDFLRPTRAG